MSVGRTWKKELNREKIGRNRKEHWNREDYEKEIGKPMQFWNLSNRGFCDLLAKIWKDFSIIEVMENISPIFLPMVWHNPSSSGLRGKLGEVALLPTGLTKSSFDHSSVIESPLRLRALANCELSAKPNRLPHNSEPTPRAREYHREVYVL